MDAISIVNLFLLLLFGTTVWLLFRDLLNKVERIDRTTDFLYETIIIENKLPIERREDKAKLDYEEWDKP
tara:strand:+ start:26404 stop:26613 length:210 start_codon:yes stop_codon:yes gene_type:complete